MYLCNVRYGVYVRYIAQRDSGTDGDVTSHLTSNAPTEIKVRTCVCECVCLRACVSLFLFYKFSREMFSQM